LRSSSLGSTRNNPFWNWGKNKVLDGRQSSQDSEVGKRESRPGKKKEERHRKRASIAESIDRATDVIRKTAADGRDSFRKAKEEMKSKRCDDCPRDEKKKDRSGTIAESMDRATGAIRKAATDGTDSIRKAAAEGVKKKKNRGKSRDRKKERYRKKLSALEETVDFTTDTGDEASETEGEKRKKERSRKKVSKLSNAATGEETPDTSKEERADDILQRRLSCPETMEEFTYTEDGKQINVQRAVKFWEDQRAAGSGTEQRRMSC